MKYFIIPLLVIITTSGFCQSFKTAIQQFGSKQYDKAQQVFQSIGSGNLNYSEAQFYMGRIAFDQKEYDDAEEYFEKAIDTNKSNAKYHYWYGNAIGTIAQNSNIIKQGFLAPKVKAAYEKAVELDPKLVDAHWALMEYYTLAPGFMGGSWEKAEQTARHISTLDRAMGHRALATVFLRQEKLDKAEKEYINLSKLDKRYKFTLGYFYQNQKMYAKAFNVFESEYNLDPKNIGALYQIGRTSALSGQQVDKGIRSLMTYLSFDEQKDQPTHAAAQMRLAMIYEKNGKNELARKNYKEALAKDPNMKLAKEGLKRVK